MTGLGREIRRRQRLADRTRPPAEPSPAPRCAAGNEATRCCIGDPWADISEATLRAHGEPLPPDVIQVAALTGVEPHALDHHIEGVHGWEPHDAGYGDAVSAAAECLLSGGRERD